MLESIQNEELTYERISPEEQQRRGILGRLVGICADFFDSTRNGRHYSEQLWEQVFDDPIMKERIENGVCYGELGHPLDREETDMEKIAVCLPEVPKKGKDGKLRAVFDILDTPNGRILKTLCDYGSTLGVSSRGSGDTYTEYDGREEVDPDTYTCQGFDIVLIPAVKTARLQYVTESLNQKKSLKESLEEIVADASEEDKKVMEETLKNLNLNESYDSKFRSIINFVRNLFPKDVHWSYDDYRVLSDDMGGGIRFQIEFDGADETLQDKIIRGIEDHFHGVDCSKGFGRDWDYYISVKVDEKACNESFTSLNEATGSRDLEKAVKETIDYIKDYFPFDSREWYGFSNWEEVAENVDYNIGDLGETAEGLIAELDASIKASERLAKHAKRNKMDFDATEIPDYVIEKDLRDDLQRAFDVYTKDMQGENLAEEKEILYIIKDKHGHQLSRPIADDSELWDRVEDRDPDGRKGLHVVVYTGPVDETLENSTSSLNIEDDSDREAIVGDEALIEELQTVLRQKQDLEQSIVTLNEKLSVCYAKEEKARVKIESLQNSVKKLTQKSSQTKALQQRVDTLEKNLIRKGTVNKSLKEQLSKAETAYSSITTRLKTRGEEKRQLEEALNQSNSTIQTLKEQIADLNKDLHQLKTNYAAKLEKSNQLVEKYKAATQGVVNKYIDSQALKLGVKSNEIKNRLPESYSLSDIDEVCEDLQAYKLNVSKLPFSTMSSLREGMQLKANPSPQGNLLPQNADDLIDEQLLHLLGGK